MYIIKRGKLDVVADDGIKVVANLNIPFYNIQYQRMGNQAMPYNTIPS